MSGTVRAKDSWKEDGAPKIQFMEIPVLHVHITPSFDSMVP